MRRTSKALAKLGAKGLLSIVGGAAALVGTACGVTPLYGAQPPYGPVQECTDDTECKSRGPGWFCDLNSARCVQPPDAGTPEDAGK